MKKDTYVYEIENSLYLNITNKCTNNCDFCIRREGDGIEGYSLWLEKEPAVEEVTELIGDPKRYKEIVFCGFGEPTMRLDALLEIAKYIKANGGKVRVNTNGLANLYYRQDITPKFQGLIDVVSISLNASNAKAYDDVCHSRFGEKAFQGLLDFALDCKKVVPTVILSVVDIIGKEEVERCQKIADDLGIHLRVREMIEE